MLPFDQVRTFATVFFKNKSGLLKREIDRSGRHPAQWEKKGSSLYTTKNVQNYPELSRTTHRLLNKLKKCRGFVFYVGEEKVRTAESFDARHQYSTVLKEAIKRINQHCEENDDYFCLILDKQEGGDEFRSHLVEQAGRVMFGAPWYSRLIEPPIEAESHLFQTLQYADWICGLIGRMAFYNFDTAVRANLSWTRGSLGKHVEEMAVRSSIRSKARKPAGV